jgi:hypothetical protein
MENKKYVCIEDLQGTEFMVGKAMTILEWKCWLLEEELERLCGYGDILDDDGAIELYQQHVAIKTDEVIPYIEKFYELKIIPLEDDTLKYIDMDDRKKLMNEEDVRKLCLELEQGDLYNNFNDYKHNNLDLSIHFDWIKKCLYGDINDVLDEISNFGAWIKQIEFIK